MICDAAFFIATEVLEWEVTIAAIIRFRREKSFGMKYDGGSNSIRANYVACNFYTHLFKWETGSFKDPFDDEGKQNEDIRTNIAVKIKR